MSFALAPHVPTKSHDPDELGGSVAESASYVRQPVLNWHADTGVCMCTVATAGCLALRGSTRPACW